MANPLAALPIHITLQIIALGNSTNGVVSFDTSLPNQVSVVPDGYTSFPDIEVAYKYFSYLLTWDSARKHCIAEGGSLAVIDSLKKIDYARSVIKSGNGTGPWVGIHRLFNTVEWVSAKTGLPSTYVPWRAEENVLTSTNKCAALWGDKGIGIGSWDCDNRLSFMCEVPMSRQPLHITINTKSMVLDKPHNNRTTSARTTIPDDFTPFPDVGVAYKFIYILGDWDSARKTCIEHNSTLAVIDSDTKKDYAGRLVNYSQISAWVGIHRLSGSSDWVSIKTGLPVPAIPWSSNGKDYGTEEPRDCLFLWYDNSGFSASACNLRTGGLCEIPLPSDYNDTAEDVDEVVDGTRIAN